MNAKDLAGRVGSIELLGSSRPLWLQEAEALGIAGLRPLSGNDDDLACLQRDIIPLLRLDVELLIRLHYHGVLR